MSDASYLEVRCERCQTSFAPGTKQCLHCGAAIGRRLLGLSSLPGVSRAPGSAPAPSEREPAPPDAQPGFASVLRIAAIAIVVLVAVARACFESR